MNIPALNQCYLKCLTEMYKDFSVDGKFSNINLYAQTYNCNRAMLSIVLKDLKIIKPINRKTYIWLSSTPDINMANRVRMAISDKSRSYSEAKKMRAERSAKLIDSPDVSKLISLTAIQAFKDKLSQAYKLGYKFIKDEADREAFIKEFTKEK